MIRSLVAASTRPRLLVVGLFACAVALTGCQAGSSSSTSQPYNPGDGRNVNVPEDATFQDDYLAIRNALVVSNAGAASATVTVVNHGSEPDVLQSISINGNVATFAGGPFDVAPGGKIAVGGGSEAVALVREAGVSPGQWTDLSLTFASAGTTTIQVPVVSVDDEYTVVGENA
ncbi:MAG TPA: hypothetical protein VFX15_09600 [Actinomycetes bacterium]|nr:hypothetical protein [Actinomycetes bacterium]